SPIHVCCWAEVKQEKGERESAEKKGFRGEACLRWASNGSPFESIIHEQAPTMHRALCCGLPSEGTLLGCMCVCVCCGVVCVCVCPCACGRAGVYIYVCVCTQIMRCVMGAGWQVWAPLAR